jgi:hypothetical protein
LTQGNTGEGDGCLPEWEHLLKTAGEACRAAKEEPDLSAVGLANPDLRNDQLCFELLSQVKAASESTRVLEKYRVAGLETFAFERWLLVSSCLFALDRVHRLPVDEEVKALWAEDAVFFARPPEAQIAWFAADGVRFREMARIATLRRFPAGQFHWEISGLPRSFIPRTPIREWLRLFALLAKVGGFSPMAETHVNARRKNRIVLTEAEGIRSYALLARSLEMQPEVKGLCTCSWLYCESTGNVTPHLAWLRRFFVENGAFLGSVGPADRDSGFLVGSEHRRKLYEEGEYRPLMTYVVWPRQSMLAWVRKNPDSGFIRANGLQPESR